MCDALLQFFKEKNTSISGWSKEIRFSRELSYSDLDDESGIYVIVAKDEYFAYEDGDNRIAYFGKGYIGKRITEHTSPNCQNEFIRELLDEGHDLLFRYIETSDLGDEDMEQLEGDLIEEFRERYGFHINYNSPFANTQQPAEKSNVKFAPEVFNIIDYYNVSNPS